MKNEEKTGAISKARDLLFTVKEYSVIVFPDRFPSLDKSA